jgi:SAM-dependent methyltransferase
MKSLRQTPPRERSGPNPRSNPGPGLDRRPPSASRTATHDPRWARVAAALATLREEGRHAVRIVDADCGTGAFLLHVARHARALGFTAIEVRGIDGSPALIGRARSAANRCEDAAIGTAFDLADMITALRDEHDVPADIVICHDDPTGYHRQEAAIALAHAGRLVIGDAAAGCLPGGAA